MTGIYMESNEKLGLLYNRYKDIPDITGKFIDDVAHSIGDEQASKYAGDKLDEFKRTIRGVIKTPEPINPRTTKTERKRINVVKDKIDTCLYKLSKLHTSYEGYKTNTGKVISAVKDSIIWARKIIIDTLNLCDQDLNLLSLVDTVYYRKIYESDCNDMMTDGIEDIMESDLDDTTDDVFDNIYNQYVERVDEKKYHADIHAITDSIPDNTDEEYFPIFPMAVSYNYGPTYAFMAPIINKVTNGDEYTHAFMSFDPEFKTVLTFGGKGLEYMTVEDYEAFKYSKSVYISVVWLTKDEMNDVKKVIKDYNEHPKDVRFSLVNFFSMMLGKIKRKDKSHCCSAFLGYLLNVANKKNLTKDYSQTRPEDTTILPRAFYVGTFKDLEDLKKKRPEFEKRIKKLYDDNIDDIREYNNSIPRIMLTDNIKRSKNLETFYKKIANKE